MTASAYMPTVVVEVAFNGGVNVDPATWTWTDITDYVELDREIKVTGGRAGEQATASPLQLKLALDNRDGRFTPELASSPYYPNVQLGKPVRVTASVQGLNGTFEDGITGWAGNNAALAQSTTQERSGVWSLRLTASTAANMSADTPSGTSGFAVAPSTTYVAWAWFRAQTTGRSVRVDVDWYNSGGGLISTTTGTTTADTTTGWTQEVTEATSPATAAFARVRAFVLSPANGEQHYVDDVMIGTVRAVAFVDEWPVDWEGGDPLAFSAITASGRLARIGQDAELASIVEEEFGVDDPTAHFPLGEPSTATQAADVSGSQHPPLTKVTVGDPILFGNLTGPGFDGLTATTFQGGDFLAANQPALAVADLTVEFFIKRNGDLAGDFLPTAGRPVWETSVGGDSVPCLSIWIDDTGVIEVRQRTGQTSTTLYMTSTAQVDDNAWHHVAVVIRPAGTSEVFIDGTLDTSTATAVSWTVTGETGPVVGGSRSQFTGHKGGLAHVAWYPTALSSTRVAAHANAGRTGFAGEASGARVARYASYADTPTAGVAADTGVAAVTHIDTTGKTVESLLRTIETTEAGVLFDARDGTLVFHDRDRRYPATSAFTIDAATQQLDGDFRPTLDRQQLLNDVSAKNLTDTLSARVKNQTSIDTHGLASTQLELATDNADEPLLAASWRVNRYATPRVHVDRLAPVDVLPLTAATVAAIAAATVGTRLTVSGLPAQAPAASLGFFVEGWEETLGPESWTFAFNVSAAALSSDFWQLNSGTLSQLGTTTVLAY